MSTINSLGTLGSDSVHPCLASLGKNIVVLPNKQSQEDSIDQFNIKEHHPVVNSSVSQVHLSPSESRVQNSI